MNISTSARCYLVAFVANLISFSVGTSFGWTSPLSEIFDSNDTSASPLDYKLEVTETAWLSSLVPFGSIFTPYIAGPIADAISRKYTLMLCSLFFIVAYSILLFATKYWLLLVARLLQGFGVGFVMTVIPMYVGEIATVEVRGGTGTLMSLCFNCGVLYVYCIGPYVSYHTLQICCLALPIIFDIFFFFMPSTPSFLVFKGRNEEAMKSLEFLRAESAEAIQAEMAAIKAREEEARANKSSFWEIFKVPGYRKALIITLGGLFLQQSSGITVILFYSEHILETTAGFLDAALSAIAVGIVLALGALLSPILADRLYRRTLLMISAFFMIVGLVALGFFFYMEEIEHNFSSITWLPVTAIILYILAYSIGYGSLPWAMSGELFPTNIKRAAVALNCSGCWAMGFVISFIFPPLAEIGTYFAFWVLALFCVLAFLFAYYIVMETKDLSLQEIQLRLHAKKE